MIDYKLVIDDILKIIQDEIDDVYGFQSNWRYDTLNSEYNRIIRAVNNAKKREAKELGKKYAFDFLNERAPLIDEVGLDEDEHHCEYVLMLERKRLHDLIGGEK